MTRANEAGWEITGTASRGGVDDRERAPRSGVGRSFRRALSVFLAFLALACDGGGGGDLAATGGMSGTGVSQGSISAFGSIFVNEVEWELSDATIELDGVRATEDELRVGMVVRIEGDLDPSGLRGQAVSVVFDDSLEGPIESDPVETTPGGPEKSFTVLGKTVFIHELETVYDEGASFAGLARDDVVEVSGFVDETGAIWATRIELKGTFPARAEVELRGTVSNLMKNPDGSGDFDLGAILVHYTGSTRFTEFTRDALANGDLVEVKGTLRIAGDEIDADEVELETEGLGRDDAEDVEIEGFVSSYVSDADFRVGGIPVDASAATFDPPTLVLADGARVEVEGRLESGILIAERVEDEDEDEAEEDVRIEAAVSEVDPMARELTIVGVTIIADGGTEIRDQSALEDENFRFDEIQPGDWLEIRGIQTEVSTARALSIERDDADPDVRLEGPVTSLDVDAPALSILGQAIPLDAGTRYFDALDRSRTEEEFFRNPGDVALGDVVRATDQDALDPEVLGEADEVELE